MMNIKCILFFHIFVILCPASLLSQSMFHRRPGFRTVEEYEAAVDAQAAFMQNKFGWDVAETDKIPPERRAFFSQKDFDGMPGNWKVMNVVTIEKKICDSRNRCPSYEYPRDLRTKGTFVPRETSFFMYAETCPKLDGEKIVEGFPFLPHCPTLSIYYASSEQEARNYLCRSMNFPIYHGDVVSAEHQIEFSNRVGDFLVTFQVDSQKHLFFIRDCTVFSIIQGTVCNSNIVSLWKPMGDVDLIPLAKWLDAKFLELNRKLREEGNPTEKEFMNRKVFYNYASVLDYIEKANAEKKPLFFSKIPEKTDFQDFPFFSDCEIIAEKRFSPCAKYGLIRYYASREPEIGNRQFPFSSFDKFPLYELKFQELENSQEEAFVRVTPCDSVRNARYVLFDAIIRKPREPVSNLESGVPFLQRCFYETIYGDDLTILTQSGYRSSTARYGYAFTGVVGFIRNNTVFIVEAPQANQRLTVLKLAQYFDKKYALTEAEVNVNAEK